MQQIVDGALGGERELTVDEGQSSQSESSESESEQAEGKLSQLLNKVKS